MLSYKLSNQANQTWKPNQTKSQIQRDKQAPKLPKYKSNKCIIQQQAKSHIQLQNKLPKTKLQDKLDKYGNAAWKQKYSRQKQDNKR